MFVSENFRHKAKFAVNFRDEEKKGKKKDEEKNIFSDLGCTCIYISVYVYVSVYIYICMCMYLFILSRQRESMTQYTMTISATSVRQYH